MRTTSCRMDPPADVLFYILCAWNSGSTLKLDLVPAGCTSSSPEPRRRIISDWLLFCTVHATQEHLLLYIKYESLPRM